MKRFPTLRQVSVVAVAVAAGTLVLPAAPASASYLMPTTIVTNQSTSDSIAQKSVSVGCPSGTKVVGVGAEIGYTADQVHITGIVPSLSGGAVWAHASEDDTGYLYNWKLTVTAVCAPTPSGYEVVSDYHAATSDPSASASAYCPPDKVLLGGSADIHINNSGWAVPRNIPDVVVNQLLNSSTSEGVHAFAFEDGNGTSQMWTLTAYAICALPVSGLETVRSYGTYSRDDTRYELLTCPEGKHVLGVGGTIFPDTGEVSFTRVEPGTYNGDDFVAVEAVEDQDGLSEDVHLGYWRMDAWAICAPTRLVTPTPISIP